MRHIREEFRLGHVCFLGRHLGLNQHLLFQLSVRKVFVETAESDDFSFFIFHRRHHDLNGQKGPILSAPQLFGVMHPSLCPQIGKLLFMLDIPIIPLTLGNDKIHQAAAKDFRFSISVQVFRGRVPANDPAFFVRHNDSVGIVVHNTLEKVPASAGLLMEA